MEFPFLADLQTVGRRDRIVVHNIMLDTVNEPKAVITGFTKVDCPTCNGDSPNWSGPKCSDCWGTGKCQTTDKVLVHVDRLRELA
jgi:DnaJ-class molecular chaperone